MALDFFKLFRKQENLPLEKPKQSKVIAPPRNLGSGSVIADGSNEYYDYAYGKKIVLPNFDRESIRMIRQFSKFNPDLGQAIFDLVMLSNTGIDIKFDPSVPDEKALEMKQFLLSEAANWHEGCAGIHGIINKMFYQIWIGGAVSNEWVPDLTLGRITQITFLNPEDVAWVKTTHGYHPYQILRYRYLGEKIKNKSTVNLNKLNTNTYKYFALAGDEDIPYGIPPMLNAMAALKNQGIMLENISFIMDLMGLLGYVDAKIEKPEQQDDESEVEYEHRLQQLLEQMQERVKQGIRDGVNVGFKEDHEFTFNSTTRETGNVEALWELNEQQVSSGLKYDSAFLGRGYNSSENSITILFTKMLSTLTNAQSIVKYNLEYGFKLALLLAGYKFKEVYVEFNKSTIQDTLKFQQAEEYKVRNARQLRMDGIISQTQYARIMGYAKPYQEEPVVPFNAKAATADDASAYKPELQRRADKKGKQEADKKTRDKSKPQGTIKK